MSPDHKEAASPADDQLDPFGVFAAGRFSAVDFAHDTQLNIVLQLLRTTERLLVVRGPSGIGKTAFLSTLLQRQQGRLRFTLVAGRPQLDAYGLFLGLASDDAHPDPLTRLQAAAMRGERPVLLIDDADRLSDQALAALLDLWARAKTAEGPLGVLLASNDDLSARLTAVLPAAAGQVHDIQLRPLSERQTLDYLTRRLTDAGIASMDLLSDTDMRMIHVRARGVPGLIDSELRRILSDRLAGMQGRGARLPALRRLTGRAGFALVLLIAALIAALFVSVRNGDWSNPAPAAPRAASPTPAPAPAAADAPTADEQSTEPPPANPAEPAEEAAPAAPIEPPAAKPAPATDAAPPAAAPAPVQAPTPAAQPAAAPAPVQTPTPAAQPAAASPPGNRWLSARRPHRFTIQLVAATDAPGVRRYIRDHGIGDRAHLLELWRDGRRWYVAVLGDYPDWAQARRALRQLPKALREDGAWVRRFDELQARARP